MKNVYYRKRNICHPAVWKMGRKKGEAAKTILVVEDSIIHQNLLIDLFKDNNILSFDIAQDGEDAVEMVKSTRYSLVIMDILMPNMDGMAALEIIKELRPDIPVIMLTALNTSFIKKRCKELGANDFVTKPFHSQKMLQSLYLLYHFVFLHLLK